MVDFVVKEKVSPFTNILKVFVVLKIVTHSYSDTLSNQLAPLAKLQMLGSQ